MRNDLLDQHRTLSKNEKCCIHCRKLSMPWVSDDSDEEEFVIDSLTLSQKLLILF